MSTTTLIEVAVLDFRFGLVIGFALYDPENAVKKLRRWSPPSRFDFG
jgi:hypothetical protein